MAKTLTGPMHAANTENIYDYLNTRIYHNVWADFLNRQD